MAKRPDDTFADSSTWAVPPRAPAGAMVKRPYLLVLSGPQFGQIFMLQPGRELTVGRREGVDILIRDDGVSRRHASILAEGTGARIRDLGSQNGTFVDGIRVTDCRLEDGNRIHVGVHSTFKFCYSDELEAEYQRKLAEGALHEPLTGLYNRRHFQERLTAELAACQRHQRALSILMIDIDHFKKVNDAYGHLAGDEALKMIAHVMQGALRKEDVLARYGGEEFVVLARETPIGGGKSLGERIRKAVERSRLSWQGQDLALTVSIGVTVSVGITHFEAGRTDRELLEAADRALYQAKQAGRNCVVVAEPTAAPTALDPTPAAPAKK
jgi:two-component system, cell cycle response regulator